MEYLYEFCESETIGNFGDVNSRPEDLFLVKKKVFIDCLIPASFLLPLRFIWCFFAIFFNSFTVKFSKFCESILLLSYDRVLLLKVCFFCLLSNRELYMKKLFTFFLSLMCPTGHKSMILPDNSDRKTLST